MACRCGVEIRWVVAREGGERLPIENVGSYAGPGRYRVVDYAPSGVWVVEPLYEHAPASGYPDHRLNCPAMSAAERARFLHALTGDADAIQQAPGGTGPDHPVGARPQ